MIDRARCSATPLPRGVAAHALRVGASALAGAAFAIGPEAFHPAALAPLLLAGRGGAIAVPVVAAFAAAALLPVVLAAHDFGASSGWTLAVWGMPLALNAILLGGALAVRGAARPFVVVAAQLVLASPPLAPLNPIAPFSLAGLLFPAFGFAGLALFAALAGVLVAGSGPSRTIALVALACAGGAAHALAPLPAAQESLGWRSPPAAVGFDTARGTPTAAEAALWRSAWRLDERDRIARRGANLALLPESALGEWTVDDARWLALRGTRVVAGARRYVDERAYVNTLVDVASGAIVYAQRAPLALRPDDAHRAVPADRLPLALAPTPAGAVPALLCIEIANPWLAATTFGGARSPVLVAANLGWSHRPALEARLRASVAQWSRLFDVPAVIAVNRARSDGEGRR